MAKRTKTAADHAWPILSPARTRVIYCGDLGAPGEQLKKLPGGSVDLITMDPPFHSHRNDEVFWGETKEQRAFQDRHIALWPVSDRATRLTEGHRQGAETFGRAIRRGRETLAERWKRAFQDRHESTQATIEFMRPRSVELARVLKKTGSFYAVRLAAYRDSPLWPTPDL